MAKTSAYDLFMLLDLESPDERRSQVVDQVRSQLQDRASLKHDVDWGTRKLSYEIDHRGEAQYHLFQFEAGPEVLSELNRSLSIEDAVLRHRIIRLPGPPPETPPRPSADEPRREERGDRGDRGRGGRGPRGGEPAAEPSEVAAEAPAPVEAAPSPEAPAEAPAQEAPAQEASAPEAPVPDAPSEGTAPTEDDAPPAPPEQPAS